MSSSAAEATKVNVISPSGATNQIIMHEKREQNEIRRVNYSPALDSPVKIIHMDVRRRRARVL
jgi:hypothetical protein